MQIDFHYYATYCAAVLAGHTPQHSAEIAFSAQLPDRCSRSFISGLDGPLEAETTQLAADLLGARSDILGRQNTTRIWASFHFLPANLHADPGKGSRAYREKYQLICGPNGELLTKTVELARGRGTQAIGLAMHVLADTWAHRYFAGTPSLVINNTNRHFFELLEDGSERVVAFRHSPSAADDVNEGIYSASVLHSSENSIMNLGHGRAGHLPDYSFARYRYLPAWGDYREIVKDNPSDYWNAFTQMVYALGCLRDDGPAFKPERYDQEAVAPWEDDIRRILVKRQIDASDDWRELGERIAGEPLEPFDEQRYNLEYIDSSDSEKDKTFLGRFFVAALAQKSMVTHEIFASGNSLAGRSIDYNEKGFAGIQDYFLLVKARLGAKHE